MGVPTNVVPARVLLVDDDIQPVELRAQVLRTCGFSVMAAYGPVQAMSIFAANTETIDVAVLDYQMPIMNGGALADRLKSCRPELKIILYSGALDIPHRAMSNVDVFIPKSAGVATLVRHITECVGSRTDPPPNLVSDKRSSIEIGS